MASRTQIVCLCEGRKGESIDEVFINRLMKSLQPDWLRPWTGSNVIRIVPCGGRTEVVERLPEELLRCLDAGGHTTLMVWADCDDDCADGETLKAVFWEEAERKNISQEQFKRVVFAFPKDRLENWIEFLRSGSTNETIEGPRVKHNRDVAESAKRLAELCRTRARVDEMPPSLRWSCRNWRVLVERLK